MGLVVRFPLEKARALPRAAIAGEGGSILVLPVIRVERESEAQPKEQGSKPRSRASGKIKRRARRPA
ncbi:MAG: hypothetical protein KF794_03600 [Xanthobacteraceae bacterium]|nr:hypothetical protein [Xanthobacteraceae bacterium]QYK45790.1 MAG: hypothetical protein KF794_03600 [Xanthobacteraceae bacterium]HMN50988.1 hypothetical protein [Xanthobacteraceae bacterium]